MIVLSIGFGPVFVGVTTAANAGVPADKAWLAGHCSTPPNNSATRLGWRS